MLSAELLAANIRADLLVLFNDANTDKGVTPEAYADRLASIISARVIAHIVQNATVKITAGQAIPPDPGITPEWEGTIK